MGYSVLYKLSVQLPRDEHSALTQIRPQSLKTRMQNARGKQSMWEACFMWLALCQKKVWVVESRDKTQLPSAAFTTKAIILFLLSHAPFFPCLLFSAYQVPILYLLPLSPEKPQKSVFSIATEVPLEKKNNMHPCGSKLQIYKRITLR